MAERKSRKKLNSRLSLKAKESVEKGKYFEDTVASLYRLLGATIIQNIEICQKKVDLFVKFPIPGSSTGHRVIVECKNEKKAVAQNQRLLQLQGLLSLARKANEADSAAIITRVPWGDKAKAISYKSGIELLTYEEKISQLIDFSKYPKDIIETFEKGEAHIPTEPPLGKYYVELKAEKINPKGQKETDKFENYFSTWIEDTKTLQHLAILGEYGTGKTSLCRKIAYDMAVQYLKEPTSHRIPILFNLREFTKNLKIESLITSFLDEKCEVINPKYSLFKAMNDAGIFALIFDGFDEMALKVDADTLEINLKEIEKLASSPKSKIILTSRIEYFISVEEERKSLHPRGEMLTSLKTEYQTLTLLPWDDTQISTFLEKRIPLIKEAQEDWTYYRDKIRSIPGLADLSHRPVLLEMIVRTLPQLIATGKPINRPNLYELYLEGEIKRQKISKQRKLLLTDDTRLSLLQQLATDFYTKEVFAINYKDALLSIEVFIQPPRSELEMYTRDFLTCSFLIRKGDEYRFSHRSIMEYLVAKALVKEIQADRPDTFKTNILPSVIISFIAEMSPDKDTLWKWIKSTRSIDKLKCKYIAGNAASVLCEINIDELSGKDLSGCLLMGANMNGANLVGTKWDGAILDKVSLVGAEFIKKDLLKAQLRYHTVSINCLVDSKLLESKEKGKPRNRDMDTPWRSRFDSIMAKLEKNHKANITSWSYSRQSSTALSFWSLTIGIPNGDKLQQIQNDIDARKWVLNSYIDKEEKEKIVKGLSGEDKKLFLSLAKRNY